LPERRRHSTVGNQPGLYAALDTLDWENTPVTAATMRNCEAVLYVTSLDSALASPADLLAHIRGHWTIEHLHWLRDVVWPNTFAQLSAWAAGELACRPGSVHPLARAGGHPSRTAVAGSLVRSTREHRAGRPRSLAQARYRLRRRALLTLLRVGFTEPPQSPAALVVSYTTVSPLPPGRSRAAVCFLWHYPAGHPGSALPTTLPFGARTFLGGSGEPEPTRPPGQLARRWVPA